jgi:hypothetical protein
MGYPNRRRFSDKSSENLEGRVSAVETAVEHIEVSMLDIRDSIKSGFQELRGELDTQNESSRPKVVAWAGWAAVVLLVIGMFGSGYVRDLNRLEQDVERAEQANKEFHLDVARKASAFNERLLNIEREVFIKEVIVNGRKKSSGQSQ